MITRAAIVFAVWLLGCGQSFGGDLLLSAEASVMRGPGVMDWLTGKTFTRIDLTLSNNTEGEVSIPVTAKGTVVLDVGVTTYFYYFNIEQTHDGTSVTIPSQKEQQFVKIHSKESKKIASVIFKDSKEKSHPLSYVIEYFVGEKYGLEFNCWHGKLRARIVR